jgi:uncharacterized protein
MKKKKHEKVINPEQSQSFSGGIHLMAKPSGPLCNLHCKYCFYLEKEALYPHVKDYYMSEEVMEAYIRRNIEIQNVPEIPFTWQGGEPLLRGLDFYRKAVKLQKKYGGKKQILNSIQTNGILLNDEWCEFFSKNDFFVGLSLDGPQDINDYHRMTEGGKAVFNYMMKALELMVKHNVQFNILACVTEYSSKKPLEVYRFFKDLGIVFIQFIPVVERKVDPVAQKLGLTLGVPPSMEESISSDVTDWSVTPEGWGDFLINIFDEWVRKDVGHTIIMNFEWALSGYIGLPSRVCYYSENCGTSPVMEHNGDIYSCDHFVYPEYKLGNILTDKLSELVTGQAQKSFGSNKSKNLPEYCLECRFLSACYGECPKRRFIKSPDGDEGLNYLCRGYKKYFNHIAPYLEAIKRLLELGEPAAKIMDYAIASIPGKELIFVKQR